MQYIQVGVISCLFVWVSSLKVCGLGCVHPETIFNQHPAEKLSEMGNLTRPFGVLSAWFTWLYLLGLVGLRFYYLVYDEAKIPADLVSNMMRARPLGALGALGVLAVVMLLFTVLDVFAGEEDPWRGMAEFTISLSVYVVVYSVEMFKRQSVDAGWLVGYESEKFEKFDD